MTISSTLTGSEASSSHPRTTAGHALAHALHAEGVRMVFGMPGGHVLDIYDGLYDIPEIQTVLVRHEHAAAAMAAGWAQLTGEIAVVVATAGPGATNLVTAVAEAYIGSTPMVVLAGRATTTTSPRGASQEASTEEVFRPITKWSVRVDRPELVTHAVRRAFAIARSGKPGPVYLDLPRDVLAEEIDVVDYEVSGRAPRVVPDQALVEAAAAHLRAARRPIVVCGGGVLASAAWEEAVALAEAIDAPVLTSLSGRGSIADDHPLSVGGLGAHRNPVSKRMLAEADVVLGLGTRFEEMETNWREGFVPAPDATYIQVDIDPAEIGNSIPATIGIVGDLKVAASRILDAITAAGPAPDAGATERAERAERARAELVEYTQQIAEVSARPATPLHPLTVITQVRSAFPRETSLAIDVGVLSQHMAGSSACFPVFEPRSVISPSSFYGMGYTTAAVPAAKLARPDAPAICFTGDGSFQMSSHIIATAAEYRLGVTWIVLNDNALGSIKDVQLYRFNGRVSDTDFAQQPDFAALAQASGCAGFHVETVADLESALVQAQEANGRGIPAVIDCIVSPERMRQSREHYPYYPPAAEGEL
ncbi:MAG TPA: thiamine pyrophosphate-binding protein [Microbacterium sp.]|uniref:thiamine pyrophosphate-binding protein n=1 Tax=Microbacterium sp. TaxID=51671 RepID=UPI002B4A7004|nr:thiamine pyrophosphate-binding protein [Microbacterium sp.]HKT58171.1 thiamine pyrophosphate-binding protein [Microbacterium sp.]